MNVLVADLKRERNPHESQQRSNGEGIVEGQERRVLRCGAGCANHGQGLCPANENGCQYCHTKRARGLPLGTE